MLTGYSAVNGADSQQKSIVQMELHEHTAAEEELWAGVQLPHLQEAASDFPSLPKVLEIYKNLHKGQANEAAVSRKSSCHYYTLIPAHWYLTEKLFVLFLVLLPPSLKNSLSINGTIKHHLIYLFQYILKLLKIPSETVSTKIPLGTIQFRLRGMLSVSSMISVPAFPQSCFLHLHKHFLACLFILPLEIYNSFL